MPKTIAVGVVGVRRGAGFAAALRDCLEMGYREDPRAKAATNEL